MRHLEQKRILITGAGRGLGREFARTFAAAGCDVIVTDIAADRVAETVNMLHDAGGRAAGYVMDVTDIPSVQNVRERIGSEVGPIDLLLNNAGVVFGGAFGDIPLDRHLATYQINLLGTITVTHTFLPDLISRPEARVINIASASGYIPLPFAATYASTKWAVIGFSESLQEELRLCGHRHVGITTVCPSYIATGMFGGITLPRFSTYLTPGRVADLTLQAVRRDREYVLTPWFVKVTPLAKAIFPRPVFRWFCDWLNVSTSMASWRGYGVSKPIMDAHALTTLSGRTAPGHQVAVPVGVLRAPAIVSEPSSI